jgi:glycosyltransferase involved in cell wall biosynthesis
MRMGIDGYNLALPHGTGVATYGAVLARTLQDAGHRIEGVFGIDAGRAAMLREILFFDQFGRKRKLSLRDRYAIAVSAVSATLSRRLHEVPLTGAVDHRQAGFHFPAFDALWSSPHLFEVAYARFFAFGAVTTVRVPNPPDVMHWTYPLPLRMAGSRNIYTLHDLVPLRLPHTTLDDKNYYWRLIARTLRDADHIVTVSQSSRNDILAMFDVSPDKVTNTYQSSPPPPQSLATSMADDADNVLSTFGLDHRGYYLFFGAIDPKKNISRIIDAFLAARSGLKLVMIASRSWGLEGKETPMLGGSRVYGQDLGDRVQTLQYLPREVLFRIIRSAKAVLCPSLYEGFGLPALEAIEVGTPVISSNVSSLPEVVGDAGLLVDPYDTQAIAGAIRALDNDDALYARLLAAGPAQAAKFSSAAYLARLNALYGKIGLAA